MIIKNALIYTENHRFEKKDVRIRNERITEIAENGQFTDPDENVIDGEGLCNTGTGGYSFPWCSRA